MTEATSTEAAALTAILLWSADLPAWQRDALRRLCNDPTLTADDHAELVAILKGAAPAKPLTADDIRDPAAGNAVVTLAALYGLSNVNALAPGEKLSFGKSGLTVIYGDNGAGKSGYARVLKQVCRARSAKGHAAILPNIYGEGGGTPSGTIDFLIGGQKRTATWRQGEATDPMLTAVSVFDSRTANVHVENTNDLAYTPLPLQILASLAEVCQAAKAQLEREIDAINAQTPGVLTSPQCTPTTPVGQIIKALSGETDPATIEALAGLTADEELRLQSLKSDLAADPARTVRHLQTQSANIENHIAQIEKMAGVTTDDSFNALRQAHADWGVAASAAAAASAALFNNEALPAIGSDVWKTLWEAARAYSRQSAYTEKSFPNTDADALCVLCHQPLTPETRARLTSFESFIQDESKRRESEAKSAYDAARASVAASALTMATLRDLFTLLRDDLGRTELADSLRGEVLRMRLRLRTVLRTHPNGAVEALPPQGSASVAELAQARDDISARIGGLQSQTDSPERLAMRATHDALKDKKWLDIVKADVLAQITRLKSIEALRAAIKDTVTNKITTKSANVALTLVTNRLRSQFAIEAAHLGVATLATELVQTSTKAGVPYFNVRLINSPKEPVARILSEGEHRCIALAAFLAELSTIDAHSAIVFDDPVSSLDHLHRDKVAARLSQLGQTRQVIVFTHDVAFMLLLDEACKAIKDPGPTPTQFRLISRNEGQTGLCHATPPANVMPLDKVLDGMKTHLGNVKFHHERGDQDAWRREVVSFQDQLRIAWERAVEDVVGPVIRRLQRKVDTTGLIKLTVLTDADCKSMRDAFGRCSALMHSQPGELNPQLPTPSAIEAEIDALKHWIDDIRSRQDKAA